jgi:hypothetical protein
MNHKKLTDEDCRAVDLLLDRVVATPQASTSVYLGTGHEVPQRALSLEKILSLLHALPAQDPPSDLTAKTLNRVGAALAALRSTPADEIGKQFAE